MVSRAIAVTPINLLLQLLLLPVYLWLMWGLSAALSLAEVWLAVVIVPLIAAAGSERWIEARPERAMLREHLAWWPVPLLALVVFLIAGAQVGAVRGALGLPPIVVPLFALFLFLVALTAKGLARLMRPLSGRTLRYGFLPVVGAAQTLQMGPSGTVRITVTSLDEYQGVRERLGVG